MSEKLNLDDQEQPESQSAPENIESKTEIEIDNETFMRGEPIEAMDFTLVYGLRPEKHRKKIGQSSKERNDGIIHKSHRSNRVSLGRGNLTENVASLKEFGGGGNVIYIIDKLIKYSKTFKPNSSHSNNAEFLIKGVSPDAIRGIIIHDEDVEKIKNKLIEIKIHLEEEGGEEAKKRNEFIKLLPIISFEEQIKKERVKKLKH